TRSAETLKNLKSSDEIAELDQAEGNLLSLYSYPKSASEPYHYLMITAPDFTANLKELADFYIQRGLSVKVVSTTDIYSEVTGIDNPERIRNYIIREYQNSGIEFVLIGGDTDVVPARGFYCTVQSSEVYTDNAIPSDLYFSALDGTWNDDNDNLWGEIGEDDLLTELSVARLTFSSADELSNMLNKIISYQSNPVLGELRDPLLVGEDLYDAPQTWGGDYMDLLIGFKTDNGYATFGIPSSHNITKMYDRESVWTRSQLISEMNQGHSYIHHDGHSNYTYNMRMTNTDVTSTNFSGVNGTDHNYTNIYSSGCMSGGFDQECIGEKFIGIENLAVSYIGNSRYGWFNEGQTEGPSIHIHREFMDALYGGRKAEIGKAHKYSKTDTAPWVNAAGQWEEGALRWCFYDCNVLGDPAMNIWTDEPENISLNHTSSITFGQSEYLVTVSGTGGNFLSNIDCALVQNGKVFGYVKTNTSGLARIPISSSYELGAAELRVSGLNTLLQSVPVSINPNESEYITLDSYSFVAGDDNLIEFGETVNISAKLKNVGLLNASDLVMSISVNDEFIALTQTSVPVGIINSQDSLVINDMFSFTVSESVPDQHEFVINLVISDPEDSWESTIRLTANRPLPEIYEIGIAEVTDDILDPGETGDIIVYLTNTGHGKLNNLTAVLSTSDERITVNTADQTYSTVYPSEVIELRYSISSADIRAGGYSSEITFSLTADNNLSYSENFFIEVGSQREDFETGDFTSYPWYFEGALPWTIEDSAVYQGAYSARSGAITHGQNTSMLLDCEVVNDGEISFYYRTSSESNYDAVVFYIDGVQKGRWSGISSEWKPAAFPVTAGQRTFKWTYLKDGSASAGDDCARIDNINFPGMTVGSSIEEESGLTPSVTELSQNYPNPFNPETNITYSISAKGMVELNVFNTKGEKIAGLAKGIMDKGRYTVRFNASDLNSGIYFYSLTLDGRQAGIRRMLLIK
ncbi:MAG: C25 family cysteine peptidase, partial [Candidatus Delongbacteria bacterium]